MTDDWPESSDDEAEGEPLRVEDLLEGLPRPSSERAALAVMGQGQPLVKMRELRKGGR